MDFADASKIFSHSITELGYVLIISADWCHSKALGKIILSFLNNLTPHIKK